MQDEPHLFPGPRNRSGMNVNCDCEVKRQIKLKLEDMKVLRCSSDLLNNVKIGQGQLQLIMK